MKTNNFDEGFFLQIIEQEAWKRLSGDSHFSWNEQLLERYKDKVDWAGISYNSAISWSSSMIEKFKSNIDWDNFSNNGNRYLYSVDNLRKFKPYWNWKILSSNQYIAWNYNVIDEFADLINWAKFIDLYYDPYFSDPYHDFDRLPVQEFFDKYKSYFPISSLKKLAPWDIVISEDEKELTIKILSNT